MRAARGRHQRPHISIVIANIPVDRDRRVCRQVEALRDAGADVTVICPRDDATRPQVPGMPDVPVVSYRRPVEGRGLPGFALEFASSLVMVTLSLVRVERRKRLRAVQFCNPPDVFAPLMLALRLFGRRVVFDHHDLSPEIYRARAGQPNAGLLRLLELLERWSLRACDGVVATNESFRQIEVSRGGLSPAKIVVARNGPWLRECAGAHRNPREDVRVMYLGVIGRQDGVDMFVRMAAKISQTRPDVSYVVVGDGEELPALRRLADELGLGDRVRFTGWLPGPQVQAELDAATVAVQPDPRNAMNELSTMAKTVEYLAHGLPVVAVDLRETRASAGDAAVYVEESDPDQLADAVIGLLDDPQRVALLGSRGRQRVASSLAWDHQISAYVGLYARWLPLQARQRASTSPRDEDGESSTAPDAVRPGGFLHGQPPRGADGHAVPAGPEHR